MERLPIRRIWVRFSLILSSFFLVLILLPLGTIVVLEQARVISISDDGPNDTFIEWNEVPEGLAAITAVVAVVGIGLGVFLSRGLSDPIVEVIETVKQIGAGDLNRRVPATNHSQELNELAEAVNTMAADLQRGETLRNNMLADISHELRTPLTVLSGQLRASLDRIYQLDESEMAHLYEQTLHLIRLVEDLRLLTQAEANQLPLEFVDVDLASLWSELEANFRMLADEKEIEFVVDVPTSLPKISADPGRLRQAFSNLLANAIRHTPTDGTIKINGRQDGDHIVVTIADSGEGISAEQLTHLFDRFYRADASRTRDTGGSGLGLAIAKAIVQAHVGEIGVESAGLGEGATFSIRLGQSGS